MSTDLTALLVAVVGVCGTLTAPLLSQRAAERSRRYETALERDLRLEEKRGTDARIRFEEKRELYTDLNAQARMTRALYKDVARLRSPNSRELADTLTAAKEARLGFSRMYNRAQMMLPEDVLPLVSTVNLLLGRGYGRVKSFDTESPDTAREEIKGFCDGELYEAISSMRRHMRRDLGIIDAGEPAPVEADITIR